MSSEFNAVMVGRYGVGKTTLFKTIKAGKPPEAYERTSEDSGVDSLFYTETFDERKVRVTLWDTGGQERHDSLTSNYYRSAHAVVLVYCLDEESSLYALSEWVEEARELSRQGDRLVLALWGTKADLPPAQHMVKPEAIEALVKSYSIPDSLNCKLSVFDSASVHAAMKALLQHLDTVLGAKSICEEDLQDITNKTHTLHKSTGSSGSTDPEARKCC